MTFIDPRSKLFAHLPRLAMLQQGGTPAPLNCEVDLSNRCSLGCEWCHFAFTHTRGPLAGKRDKPAGAIPGGDLMDTELAFRMIDQLTAAGAESITWTGGGEPTLHPDFDRIVEYANGKLEQGLYTHGGHIDETRAALLKRLLTFVYVSLDAADAAAYRRDKGVDRFKQACDGIANLADADGQCTVGVGYLVTETNWRDAPKAVPMAAVLGADYIQFRPTVNYRQDEPGSPDEDTGWMTDAVALLEEHATSDFVVLDADRFRQYQRWNGHGYHRCWWSNLQTVVTPNGKVWTCVNKREHASAEIGDLSRESFAEIWARKQAAMVNKDCRVMCRGHIPNLVLNDMLAPREHAAFV